MLVCACVCVSCSRCIRSTCEHVELIFVLFVSVSCAVRSEWASLDLRGKLEEGVKNRGYLMLACPGRQRSLFFFFSWTYVWVRVVVECPMYSLLSRLVLPTRSLQRAEQRSRPCFLHGAKTRFKTADTMRPRRPWNRVCCPCVLPEESVVEPTSTCPTGIALSVSNHTRLFEKKKKYTHSNFSV